MICIKFTAHRKCYREVMQELRDENPMEELEFDIILMADEEWEEATHSEECVVSDFRTNMDDYTGRPVAEN